MRVAVFERAEYLERLARTKARMEAAGFDLLFVTDPSNIYYLSGYDAWSFYVPQAMFLPVQGEPLLYLRAMDAAGAHRFTELPPEQIIAWPEGLIHRTDTHPFVWIAGDLRERGVVAELKGQRVAYEGGAQFFNVISYLALVDGIPEWDLQDSGELVNWVRVVKSPAEIEVMRKTAQITDRVMTAAIEGLRPGRRQSDLAAEILAAQVNGTPEIFGDATAVPPLIATGEAADTPHLTWGPQVFEAGQQVSFELAAAHRHYTVPMARTVTLGKPSDDLARLAASTLEASDAVLDAIRPGVVVGDVVREWDRRITAAGFSKASRLGYSIGIGFPPDWGERTVSLRVEDTTELQVNMTFHVIAGMWMTGYGFELSSSVRVAEDGVEILGSIPRQLIAKE
jgi:Xaa-Pro dipeptidase